MRIRRWLLASTLFMLTACAPARTAPAPPPPVSAPVATSGLSVLLTWEAPVDLDLYVTDPTFETVYFANNPTRTGARLLRDARCADVLDKGAPPVEQANLPNPQPGRYRVGVDFIDVCTATKQPASFRVVIEFGGQRREITGTIRPQEFEPIVTEFSLHPLTGDGPLALSQEDS